MAESVLESLQAVAGEMFGGDEPSDGEQADWSPSDEPAAETDDKPETVADTLEASLAELEAADRDVTDFEEVFQPIAGKMREAGMTKGAVVRQALALAEQLHRSPDVVFAQLAAHLRANGADPDSVLRQAADPVHQHFQAAAAAADSKIREFAAQAPDFEAVRQDCGEILSAAAARGEVMTLQEAYELAAEMAPFARSSTFRARDHELRS